MNPRVVWPHRFHESSDQPQNRWRCESSSSSAALLTPFKTKKKKRLQLPAGEEVMCYFKKKEKKHKTAKKKWPLYCKQVSSNTVHESLNPFPCNDSWSSLKLNNHRMNHLFQISPRRRFPPLQRFKKLLFSSRHRIGNVNMLRAGPFLICFSPPHFHSKGYYYHKLWL